MTQPLGRLLTDLGERSTYDAVSQCSRCGYCEQACPTYVATGLESRSPRGRNQVLRLLLEGKVADARAAQEALSTCLLCGACQTACYAHVPTPDLVLEARRRLAARPPWPARAATRLLLKAPRLFARLLRLGYAAKRMGLSRLAWPALRLAGLPGLAEADAHVEEAPRAFLADLLRRRRWSASPKWLYFAPCGPNYVLPRVGLATVGALEKARGRGAFLDAGCCGLLAYNYGELPDARAFAQRVIGAAERMGQAPVVADCSSCAAFLKSYPQLFLGNPVWRRRAERLAARVKDVVEVYEQDAPAFKTAAEGPAAYHESCRACHGQGLKRPDEFLKETTRSQRPLADAQACCGGAGAFAFVHPELSEEVLKRKIDAIAATGATLVVTSSTSCLLQLAHGLRKYYPSGAVVHVSELAFLSDGQGKPDGAKTGA